MNRTYRSCAAQSAISLLVVLLVANPLVAGISSFTDTTFAAGVHNRTEAPDDNLSLAFNENTVQNWTTGVPFSWPSGRSGHVMAYDNSGSLLLFGGDGGTLLNDTWVFSTSTNKWKKIDNGNAPSPRRNAATAFDTGNGVFVLFGGYDGAKYTSDTWTFSVDSKSWTLRNPAAKPSARDSHAMAYNPVVRETVLLGGYNGSATLGDTWTYNASSDNWTYQFLSPNAPSRFGHALYYDSLASRCRTWGGTRQFGCNTVLLNDFWELSFGTSRWLNITTSSEPAGRSGHAMAYSPDDKRAYLFGGNTNLYSEGGSNDTWYFDGTGNKWNQLTTSNTPMARSRLAMVYLPGLGQVAIFGGDTSYFGLQNDFWALNSGAGKWYNFTGPAPRAGAVMTQTSNSSKTVMFGGNSASGNFDEVWAFDSTTDTWTLETPKNKAPPARTLAAAVFDSKKSETVLFGGKENYYNNLDDTWTYDESTLEWTEHTSGTKPTPRDSHAMAYDIKGTQTILFGGNPGYTGGPNETGGAKNDTWVLSTADYTWTKKTPATSPGGRFGHGMVYDPASKAVIMFGGTNGTMQNDTWVYDPGLNNWTSKKPSGAPSPRTYFSFVFDQYTGEAVLFGGNDANGPNSETWTYNLTNNRWTKWTTVTAPGGRSGAAACPVGTNGTMMIYGGEDINKDTTTRYQGDVWYFKTTLLLYQSGNYTSRVIDAGAPAQFGNITWNAPAVFGTTVKLQFRSAASETDLAKAEFTGPAGKNSVYITPGTPIENSSNGNRYFQFRAFLSTNYTAYHDPFVKSVVINYNLRHSINLTSPSGGENWTGTQNVSWKFSEADNDTVTVDVILITPQGNKTLAQGLSPQLNYTWNTTNTTNGTYRLVARARDAGAIPYTAQSFSGNFTIFHPPPPNRLPAASLLQPIDGFVVDRPDDFGKLSVNLQWTGSDPDGDPVAYHVLLMKSVFDPNVTPVATVSDATSYKATNLADGFTYFWTVIPDDSYDRGANPPPRKFTVKMPPPADNKPPTVNLTAPADGAALQTTNVELTWSGSDPEGAQLNYFVLFSQDPIDLLNPPTPVAEGNNTGYVAAGLTDGRTYYWTVIPNDGRQSGKAAPVRSFSVQLPVVANNHPPFVTLILPPDGAVTGGTSIQLAWNGTDADSDIITYFVFFSNQTINASALPAPYAALQQTSCSIDGLKTGTKYFWAVIPSDGRVNGTMSEMRSFRVDQTIQNSPPVILSHGPVNATPGEEYIYNISARDPDGDTLQFFLASSPVIRGMFLDRDTGSLSWTPSTSQTSNHSVVIRVIDGRGGSDEESYIIYVRDPTQIVVKPSVNITSHQAGAVFNGTVLLTGTANRGTAGAITVRVSVDGGSWTNVSGTDVWFYQFDVSGLSNGTHTINVIATDGRMVSDPFSFQFAVENPKPVGPVVPATNVLQAMLPYILIAVIGAITTGAGAYAYSRRKRKAAGNAAAQAPVPPAVSPAPPAPRPGYGAPVSSSTAHGSPGAAAAVPASTAPAIAAASATAPADFALEDAFLMYEDGRLIQHATRRIKADMDVDVLTSMLKAVQDFVRDSFGRDDGSELGSMEYGESKILIRKGKYTILAAVLTGAEPTGFRDEMTGVLSAIETEFGHLLEKWNGETGPLAGTRRHLAQLGAYLVPEAHKSGPAIDVDFRCELEFYQGFVRVKVAVKNGMATAIRKVALKLVYDDDSLRLDHIEPRLAMDGKEVQLGDVEPHEKRTVAFYLDPQICTESFLEGILNFKDAAGHLETLKMPRKLASVVCPIMFTDENINTAMLKRMAVDELEKKDSKVFNLPANIDARQAFDIGKTSVQHHDVRLVREFEEKTPFIGEAWYFGKAKGRADKMIIRVRVLEERGVLEFHVACSSTLMLTGMLAELKNDLNRELGSIRKGVTMKPVAEEDTLKALRASRTLLESSDR